MIPALNALPLYAMNTAPELGGVFTRRSAPGAGPRRTWSTPTTRATSPITRWARCRLRPGGTDQAADSRCTARVDRVHSRSTPCPNAFDPPSGFLATANSRVTTDKSPYPLTLEWARPVSHRAHLQATAGARRSHAERHDRGADRHLQRRRPGDCPPLGLRHRPRCGRRRPPAQGRRPDAQLGRQADHGFSRCFDGDPGPRRAVAADSRTEAGRPGERLSLVGVRISPRKKL